MTFSKIVKFGCLGFVALILLMGVFGMIGRAMMSPEERAGEDARRQATPGDGEGGLGGTTRQGETTVGPSPGS